MSYVATYFCALLAAMDILSWAPYNQAGIPVPMDPKLTSADIDHAVEQRGKQVFDNMHPRLVKIYGFSRAGEPASECSGFLYGTLDVIVTTSYVVGPDGGQEAEVFKVCYSDGHEEEVELLKCATNHLPDVAILRGSRSAPRTMVGTTSSMGAIVYALGFPTHANTPSFRTGSVSGTKLGDVAITSDVDSGFSGGPVVSLLGELVGTVKGGPGTQVRLCSPFNLHTFLLQSGLPGLA